MGDYNPEAFDRPVRDYDFSTMRSTDDLIRQMGDAGGFTAPKLTMARDLLGSMFAESTDPDVVNWLSFPAALCATGTRGFFLELIKRKLVHIVITTCGTLDHDLARTYRDYFHGDFNLDDVALGEIGLNRLGNVIIPNECYGDILEQKVLPWIEEIDSERSRKNESSWSGFGTVQLCWALGDRIEDESSILHWAAKNRIPIVVPGITDGSIGAQLFMHRQKNPSFMMDILADEQICSDMSWTAKKSNALMVGGGISKHHVIWWNQYRGGLDSAVGISTAPEYDGSLSGARLKEAISWGKIRPDAPQVLIEGEASLILPILGASIFGY